MSDEISHERAQEFFTDYREGTLGDGDRSLLERHLDVCPDCTKEWNTFQQMMSGLAGLKQQPPPPAADLVPKTTSKIHRRTRGMFFRNPIGKAAVPYELIALAFLLFLGVAYWLIHSMWPSGGTPLDLSAPKPTPPTPSPAPRPAPRPDHEPTSISGQVVLSYSLTLLRQKPSELSLDLSDAEKLRPQLERTLLTATGALGPWVKIGDNLVAEFTVPADKLGALYKDLGQSFAFIEERLPQTVPLGNPTVTGRLVLRPAP
jgi:hypothetical protein